MILNKECFIPAHVLSFIIILFSGCVDIPDKAPEPPELKADFRFLSLTPSDVVTPSSFKMAEVVGRDNVTGQLRFGAYNSISLPPNGTPTPYMTFNAGTKKIVYFDGDTLAISFETDQRATVIFALNPLGSVDAVKLPYRYTFAPNGIADTTIVRFSNFVLGATDTIDVFRSDSTFAVRRMAVDNLRRGATSGGASLVKIPAGRSYKFFFTHSSQNTDSDTSRIFKDSIEIVGVSRKVFSVLLYDRFDSSATPSLRNSRVKVKVLEEL